MLHILIGGNDERQTWEDSVKRGRPAAWIVPKVAGPGDDALFVFNKDRFVGSGVIATEPEATTFYGQAAYRADVRDLKQFKRALAVDDVARRIPEWKWPASSTKGRTTPADEIARKLHRILHDHVARVGLALDEAAAPSSAKEAAASRYRRADENPLVGERDPFEVDPEKIERGNRGHAVTQNALADFLAAQGITPLSPVAGEPEFDVAWSVEDLTYVAEVKSLTNSNEEKQLRLGLGQVLRYRYLMAQRGAHVMAVLVAEREPNDRTWASTCGDLGVVLVWPAVFDELR